MIINTGQRTDIPGFYAQWFANRLKEGIVCVRNPYNPDQVSRYRLDPSVVDAIGFCTKNPAGMFPYMDLLKDYGQLWQVSITPYGKDIEPNVPDKHVLLEDFKKLSSMVGINSVFWRYDPIFISERYTLDYHLRAFEKMAKELEGYTETVVISFIDLYQKVKVNFPEVREVNKSEQIELGKQIIKIASEHGMTVRPCAEGDELAQYGAECSGCTKISDYEKAIGEKLTVPPFVPGRKMCSCYISADIGAYNTCRHLCRYCYANSRKDKVMVNARSHDPHSPFLIGTYQQDDQIHDVEQKSWIDRQIRLL